MTSLPQTYRHGTTYSYTHGCRCDDCRAANAKPHRRRRERGQRMDGTIPHGTNGGYSNYDCRCRPCTDAHVRVCAAYKARVRIERAS
jgi:hypothetical protein